MKTKKIIKGCIIIGGALGLFYLNRRNNQLKREVSNLEGQVQNQKDLIKGYQKMAQRDAFIVGKLSAKKKVV